MNRRRFLKSISCLPFAGLFFCKPSKPDPMQYYKKEFKQGLLKYKDIPSVFRSKKHHPETTMSDFYPEKSYGVLMSVKDGALDTINEDNKFTVGTILADHCAGTIPREFRHKAELIQIRHKGKYCIGWAYNKIGWSLVNGQRC